MLVEVRWILFRRPLPLPLPLRFCPKLARLVEMYNDILARDYFRGHCGAKFGLDKSISVRKIITFYHRNDGVIGMDEKQKTTFIQPTIPFTLYIAAPHFVYIYIYNLEGKMDGHGFQTGFHYL